MEGWRDGVMEGWRDGGMEGWRDGGMEGWRDGGREGGREGEGVSERLHLYSVMLIGLIITYIYREERVGMFIKM
jgi:hypothetical protein